MNLFYSYIHARPDGSVFYVGNGKGRRYLELLGRNPYHQNVVNKYGAENILVGKIDCSSEAIAFDIERGLIKCFRRMGVELTNLTDGGEGTSNPSPETRAKLSKANIGNTKNLGKKLPLEKRVLIRERQLGEKGYWFGKTGPNAGISQKEESNIRRSLTQRGRSSPLKGRKLSADHARKIGLTSIGNKHNLGRKASTETKVKMSVARKGKSRPEHSLALNGRKRMNNGDVNKMIDPSDFAAYLQNGWVFGSVKK